ncbi:MAG: cell wall hydrolase [Lachnospiraceae bacterium]|nr:cell wall hydrolase [Lachnospiraceae bacterium]
MKRNSKKHRQFYTWIALTLALSLTLSCLPASEASAAKSGKEQELEEQIDDVRDEIKDLEDQQKKNDDALDDLQNGKGSLQQQLNTLNATLEEISGNLERLSAELTEKEAQIETARADLEQATQDARDQYASMVVRLRNLYERNDAGLVGVILGQGTISQLLNTADYMERIERYEQNKLQELKDTREEVAQRKAALEEEQRQLEELQEKNREESKRLTDLIETAQAEIEKYRDDIDAAEARARELEQRQKESEEDLETLKKLLEEERRKSKEAIDGTWRDIADVTFDEGDEYLLASLIYCEAGGEPYEGQVAVGAVVINRVLSGVFPETVSGVIYQRGQFSPVASGRLALVLSSGKATESCHRAAQQAMTGFTNVGSCVYFRTPVPGLEGIQIGGHIFY